MGIPYYFYTIYKKYNCDDKKLLINENDFKNMNIKYLFLDYNSMIHPCAHDAINLIEKEDVDIEDFIITKCLVYTNCIIELLNPEHVYIMIDGVAPRAKINQQRERRYKSELMKTNSGQTNTKWNSNKITPGTLFMKKLSKRLHEEYNKNKKNIIVNISDSDEPGEGEHKMMSIITKLELKQNDKIFIYGLDADLIMLSLLNKYNDNIILLRDNTFNDKLKESQKIFTYLDIHKLKNCIQSEMQIQLKINANYNNLNDYIFLCILLGNDFLEHIPSLIIKEGALNVLLKCYCKCFIKHKSHLTTNAKTINIVFLKDLLFELSKNEEYFFKNIWSIYSKNNKIVYKDAYPLEDFQNHIIYTEDYIKYNLTGYKWRYYNFYGVDNLESACKNYIDGLNWVWGYYNGHNHNNWSWYYKYHAVPFASDLFNYLNTKNHNNNNDCLGSSSPLKPIQQLIMVLPKKSLLEIIFEIDSTLADRLKRLLVEHKYFPDILVLDMIHREYLWQSKLFLEPIDLNFVNYLLI